MDFEQKKKINNNEQNYHLENLKIAREFSKELITEMNELVRSIVIFGSNAKANVKKDSDVDLLIVLDNVSVFVSEELREAYRIITTKLVGKISNKLHITTMNLTDLWNMARKGDPILINILRHGLPLFDRDLIEPMQYLLEIGKIKPSLETVHNYEARAENLLEDTNKHMYNAILDLYYAVIDMVHSTLILRKITPPSPKEMPNIFKQEFSKTKLAKFSKDIEELYLVSKKIDHKKSGVFTGKDYDYYKKKAENIITSLKQFNQNEIKKKDQFDM